MVMDSDKWTQWMTSFQTMKGSFSFPKFDVEYRKDLKDVLSKMGMGIAFRRRVLIFAVLIKMANYISIKSTIKLLSLLMKRVPKLRQ